MEQLFHDTCTNCPIPFVARPTRAVIRAKSVSTVCIYVTVMTFVLAFIDVWNKKKRKENLNRQDFKTILYLQCYLQVRICMSGTICS